MNLYESDKRQLYKITDIPDIDNPSLLKLKSMGFSKGDIIYISSMKNVKGLISFHKDNKYFCIRQSDAKKVKVERYNES